MTVGEKNMTPLGIFMVASLVVAAEGGGAPAMFVFGDSLVDNGNNNFIPSPVRADFDPYGIDLGSPTGRFCNGLTAVDVAAWYLGLPYPPPYLGLAAQGGDILNGINYASGAAGILDTTGEHFGARITLNGQLELFELTVLMQLPAVMAAAADRSEFLARSVFVVNIGSNDFINDLLLRDFDNSDIDLLFFTLAQQLTKLYDLGARKIVVAGIGPLGCMPSQLAITNYTTDNVQAPCVNGAVNNVVSDFNRRLLLLTADFVNSTLKESFVVYHDSFLAVSDIIQRPEFYGFDVADVACCGSGNYGGQRSCMPDQVPCTDRDKYVFWDAFHPTQASNAVIAARCYSPSADTAAACYPISGYQLAQI